MDFLLLSVWFAFVIPNKNQLDIFIYMKIKLDANSQNSHSIVDANSKKPKFDVEVILTIFSLDLKLFHRHYIIKNMSDIFIYIKINVTLSTQFRKKWVTINDNDRTTKLMDATSP